MSACMRRPYQPGTATELQQILATCKCGGLKQLEAMSDELDQAKALLASSLGSLRADFEEIAQSMGPDVDANAKARISQAILALQCEDALTQMLDHLRIRAGLLAGLLERVEPLALLVAQEVVFSRDEAGLAWIKGELGEISNGLHKMGAMPTPVANRSPASGVVEIF